MNIKWSGMFIQKSLGVSQLQKVIGFLDGQYNGPVCRMYIMNANKSSSSRALRAQIAELEKIKLSSFNGETIALKRLSKFVRHWIQRRNKYRCG